MKFHQKLRSGLNDLVKTTNRKFDRLRSKMNNDNKKAVKRQRSLFKTSMDIFSRFVIITVRMIMRYLYGENGAKMPPIKDLVLLDSATSLAHKIRTRKLTSVEVTESFIARIREVNPLLNCVVDDRFDDALRDAAKADKLIESGTLTEEQLLTEKPFLGVPITTKDCIQVQGLLCTSGIVARKDYRADQDADVIALMRKAGAIPLAVTNVSECCMWWESFNKNHGRTRNPYDTNRIVGGSSGGEGCIQGAAASPFGIGSDIGGSIRMPAFFNGIFGHKPSKFVISNEGQYPAPVAEHQKSFLGTGPMCRHACDLKPMLKILSDKNAKMLRLDEPVDLNQVRFFYQENDGGGHLVQPVESDIREGLDRVVHHLKRTLKTEVKKVKLDAMVNSAPLWFANMKGENIPGFDAQLMNMQGTINVYWELLKLLFGQSNFTFVALMTVLSESAGVQYGSEKHKYLVEQKEQLLREFQTMLGTDGVFLYPTHPSVAPYHNEPIFRALNFSYTGIINMLGLPATAVPLGLGREGLPLGIQVVGNVNQDRLCLAVAAELERAFGGWVAPEVIA